MQKNVNLFSIIQEASKLEAQANTRFQWIIVSQTGTFSYLNLAHLCTVERTARLQQYAAEKALGTLIQKGDSVFAAMHETHSEKFQKQQQGLKIEGKSVKVISLKDADYAALMSYAIQQDTQSKKVKDKHSISTEVNAPTTQKVAVKSLQPLNLPTAIAFFNVRMTFHSIVMDMIESMQRHDAKLEKERKIELQIIEKKIRNERDELKIAEKKIVEQRDLLAAGAA